MPTSRVKYTHIVFSWVTYGLIYLLYSVWADKCVQVLNENTLKFEFSERTVTYTFIHYTFFQTLFVSVPLSGSVRTDILLMQLLQYALCILQYVRYEHVQYVWNAQMTCYCNLLKCNQSIISAVCHNAMSSTWFSSVIYHYFAWLFN